MFFSLGNFEDGPLNFRFSVKFSEVDSKVTSMTVRGPGKNCWICGP
jgi:hypothetical protein